MIDEPDYLFAFGLTTLAGLSTGIGSAIAFFSRRTNEAFLSGSLGFSAGVMIYVSFVELFAQGTHQLSATLGESTGGWASMGAFFGGILLIAGIDRLIPSFENPHEVRGVEGMQARPRDGRLMRMGLLTALGIGIHNFPEGMATFAAALSDPTIGVSIAIAIAIHNIPEGISVSVPIFYATGDRKKAFWYSFLSGVSEPVGALIAYLVLSPLLTPAVLGATFSVVAGIMVFISLDELLPAAREYGGGHHAIYGLVAGMAVMGISLQLL